KGDSKLIAINFLSHLSTRCHNDNIGHRISRNSSFNYRCRNKFCMVNFNILEKTTCKGAKLEIWKIIRIYDCWLYGMLVKDISFLLRTNKNTVTRHLKSLEDCITDNFYNIIEPLDGKNIFLK
ncbi:hypothetical protein H311_03166, partial [Anncaliia algerae PRA109]